MKKILFTVVASMLVGCGGAGDVCSAKSKCSGDPAQTQAAIDSCKALAASGAKCSAEFNAYGSCAVTNQKCTADNLSDNAATAAACATQFTAYTTCFAKP